MATRLFFLFAFLLFSTTAFTQVDTEFWFAPPEASSGHGDRPLYLRISTLDQQAQVKISQPARNQTLSTVTVSANTTYTFNLSNYISYLETNLPAQVMNTGIKVTSTAPVTAYYEIGSTWNADIFALKGKNALGNDFVIPAQNYYSNSADYSPLPYSSFDIVATQNNTVVRVRPTKPIYGHENDTIITIKLNAGQTYSFRKTNLSASNNPAGTVVESNKPVAITLKDDSVINGGCRDLLGDQLVPVKVTGSEYIVLKGFLATDEYLFVTAIDEDTEIHINGNTSPNTTLDAGEVYRYRINSKSTYIKASKPVYVYHVTGFGCEMGMAILPSINCKGSQQIGFTRTTSDFFGLNVLVRKEGINSFTINGSNTLIPASGFSAVPGTNDEWYTAQLSFTTSQILVGQASLISNDQYSFQVGIINGDENTTCRYGYFSAFSTLFIGDDFKICEGETITLDAGSGKETYKWNTGATSQTIDISSAGEYWVMAEKESCLLFDTIKVEVEKGKVNLGPDLNICEGDTATIDGKENFSWLWSDGTKARYLQATEEGKYWISVFDYTGCQASDTIFVSINPKPDIDLGKDMVKCPLEEVELNTGYPGATYLWNTGQKSQSITVMQEGKYWCKVTDNGCSMTDSISITNLPGPPQDTIYGSPSVCPFSEDIRYAIDPIDQSQYDWFVDGGVIAENNGSSIMVNWNDNNVNASVKALVTDSPGCKSDTIAFPVRINVELEVELPNGPDTLCFNQGNQVIYETPVTAGSIYTWKIEGGNIIEGQGTHEVLIDWQQGMNKLWIEESSTTVDTVCSGISQQLQVLVFNDSTDINLHYASVDTATETSIHLQWSVTNPQRIINDSLFLFKSIANADNWQLIAALPADANEYTDQDNFTDDESYEYQISYTNKCDELISSDIHNTILLKAQSDTIENTITLSWNHYLGWDTGVKEYQIWRKLDSEDSFSLFTSVEGNITSIEKNVADDGFDHTYYVKAIQKYGPFESYSNRVDLSFEHPVEVPNVFTPNNDDYNQYFTIKKIELYKNSQLTIMDRWGRTIYETTAYQNNWDGEGVSTGVYYYVLDLKKDNQVIKGTVSILR